MLDDSKVKKISGMRKVHLKQRQSAFRNPCVAGHRNPIERAVYGNINHRNRPSTPGSCKEKRELEIKRAVLQIRLTQWAKTYKTKKTDTVAVQMAHLIVEIEDLNFKISRFV